MPVVGRVLQLYQGVTESRVVAGVRRQTGSIATKPIVRLCAESGWYRFRPVYAG